MTIDLVAQIETRLQARKTLKEADRVLLQTLARVKFATREQLALWCGIPYRTVLRHLVSLQNDGFISAETIHRPTIWKLKPLGASFMLTSVPAGKRPATWSVMAHTCHVNEVEIMLSSAKDSKGFHFIDKVALLKQGLHPGFGEHGGRDDAKKDYLILLDDYLMKPERIDHTWTRVHHPPRKFFDGNRTLSWSKIVNYFIVATTDEFRAEQHAAWIERHEIPARVITIKPLWG